MISSINTNQTAFGQMRNNAISNAKIVNKTKEDTQTVKEEADGKLNQSADGDTVTISAASMKTFVATSKSHEDLQSGQGVEEGTYGNGASIVSEAAASVGIDETTQLKAEMNQTSAAVSGSSTSSDSASSLSQYSESELREMLNNGEISRAEYDEEIASRNGENGSEEKGETTVVSNDALETE